MDLMRALLVYMSATLALAVQNTTAPKETPEPTPAPEAIVETGEMPSQVSDAITAVPPSQPADTAKITPLPVPTITPNMKAYHNLTMGAKGKEVKKLQEKLIEMGYLPEGSADGAYGRKTFNAIKKFQYYNGLTADGIAGRRTQTYLFENPDAAPNPEVTVIPETASPAESTAPDTKTADTEAPETIVPETEAPETEAAEPAEEPEITEEPEAAEEPETTEEPVSADNPEEDEPDIIENVDLDADVYEPITAMIALNEGDGPLEFVVTEDGVPVKARPRLSQNGDRIRVSLDDLCSCVEEWQLTDDNVGTVVLEAAGYTLALYNEDGGCSATVDGKEISMKDDDFDFTSEGHFINAEFLASALKGEAIWDQEDNTLMLRIRDRESAESAD